MNSETAKKIFSGTALQIASRLIVTGATLFLFALLSRSLDKASFGRLIFYVGLLNLLDVLVDFGISPAALRKASVEPERTAEILRQAQRERFLCALAGVAAVPVIAWLYGDPLLFPTIFAAVYLLTHPLGLAGIQYQRELKYLFLVIVRVLGMALTLMLSLGFFLAGNLEWEWHLGCFVAGWTFSNLLLFFFVHLENKSPSTAAKDSLFKTAWPLGVSTFAQQAYFNAGIFFVRTIAGDSAYPLYGVPHRGFVFGLMIPSYLTGTAMPLLASSSEESLEKHRQLRRKLLQLLLWLGIPVAAFTIAFAPEILRFVFGPDYSEGANALRWLAVAGLGVVFGSVAMTCLVAQEKTTTILKITLSVAAISLLTNYFFVREWGATGAGAANALCESLVAALAWGALFRAEAKR